ncbi:hypothetical protein PHYSODRAFT_246263 [Phytophthora sojae]|uniref:SWIM-type domain-containing protein n=1 Tax=Phytophthora sojae (strain P6497) TaxID=1094619 RepID=G4YJ05_PHYSP|nr:hypothetical protein PHYSODRAFT_246263 [Phytophthora sojae]EGZ29145.1 hypothetical protein PHYSODRAFT_246263 [Phytophthora sojae]|eukprot:XP_009516420.1 hypothetical protein PHYSODRAFT_246263 [Phytophthora sojae]
MVHDLRVKAVARAPRRSAVRQAARGASGDDGSDSSYCPPADIGSEEEWEDSASSASSHASQPKKGRTEALGHPRTPRGADEEEPEVAPPPLTKREFGSWGELKDYLSEYSTASYQSFRVRTNNKVSARNKKIKESASTKPLVPEEWVFYGKTFVCTHAGKYKARGQGKRKRQQSRALECEAQVGEHTFRQYPRNRNALEPEVLATVDTLLLMVDATHGTNSSKYKVFSIMAHDVFGKGQFVQHAVVQNERLPTLLTALEEFKRNNPAWTRIRCVLIDKDFTEISVLKMVYHDAVLLLCQFHVIKYLREEIASAEYGFNAWQKQQLQGLVQLLVYAKTEREYKRLRDYMHYIMGIGRRSASGRTELGPGSSELGAGNAELGAGDAELESDGAELDAQLGAGSAESGADAESNDDDPQHPFEAYFVKNWDKCRSMWCAFEHQNAVTLGNDTKNRIEALWKQLKDLVDSFMEVDECIVSIMYYQAQEEKKFMDSLFKLSVVHDPKYDREMQLLSNLISSHACELIYEQYVFATTRDKYKYKGAVPGVFLVQYVSGEEDALDEPTSKYLVMKCDLTCSCMFMTSRLLPCRHVFYLGTALGFESIIPAQLLHPRWLLTTLRSSTDAPQLPGAPFAVSSVLPELGQVGTRIESSGRLMQSPLPLASI